jgi:hypothetical protein
LPCLYWELSSPAFLDKQAGTPVLIRLWVFAKQAGGRGLCCSVLDNTFYRFEGVDKFCVENEYYTTFIFGIMSLLLNMTMNKKSVRKNKRQESVFVGSTDEEGILHIGKKPSDFSPSGVIIPSMGETDDDLNGLDFDLGTGCVYLGKKMIGELKPGNYPYYFFKVLWDHYPELVPYADLVRLTRKAKGDGGSFEKSCDNYCHNLKREIKKLQSDVADLIGDAKDDSTGKRGYRLKA